MSDELREALEATVAALERLEWSRDGVRAAPPGFGPRSCPCCGGQRSNFHDSGCGLWAAIDAGRRALAAAPAEAHQPVAWLCVAPVEARWRRFTTDPAEMEMYASKGYAVTPLVPQRATPQPSEEA